MSAVVVERCEVQADGQPEYTVLPSIGCPHQQDSDLFCDLAEGEVRLTKAKLDVLHFAKIDLSDEILVLDCDGGYIGESTEREIEYARMRGKAIRYLSREAA
jgi:hypothetical protein